MNGVEAMQSTVVDSFRQCYI